jgi:hypothetical protein
MKLLVYTYGILPIDSITPDNTKSQLLLEKTNELKEKFPYITVMVIPGPKSDGDKVHVLDLTVPGPPLSPSYPNPIWHTPNTGLTWTTTGTGPVMSTWSNIQTYAPYEGQASFVFDGPANNPEYSAEIVPFPKGHSETGG